MARYGRYHLGIGGVPVLRRRSILGRPGSENAARRRTVGVPEKKTARPARKTKSPSTQAGEYVREEVEHVRGGKHGARSAKQVIAIGPVSYTHLRAHETVLDLVCRLLLEKKKH